MLKNVIIDEIKLSVEHNGKEYNVFAYALDTEESDQYCIEITNKEDINERYLTYIDSCGGQIADEYYNITDNEVVVDIIELLFHPSEQSIIKGF